MILFAGAKGMEKDTEPVEEAPRIYEEALLRAEYTSKELDDWRNLQKMEKAIVAAYEPVLAGVPIEDLEGVVALAEDPTAHLILRLVAYHKLSLFSVRSKRYFYFNPKPPSPFSVLII